MALSVTNYHTVQGRIFAERNSSTRDLDYLTDALGSVTELRDPATQSSKASVRYLAYGKRSSTSASVSLPKNLWVGAYGYRRTGRWRSDLYIRARHLGLFASRWTSIDPLWPEESAYGYVGENPIAGTDPSGYQGSISPPLPKPVTPPWSPPSPGPAPEPPPVPPTLLGVGLRCIGTLALILLPGNLAGDTHTGMLPFCPPCRPSYWRWEFGCHFIKELKKCCIGPHGHFIRLTGQAAWPSCKCFYQPDRNAGKCLGLLAPGPCPPRTDPRCRSHQWAGTSTE